MDINGRFGRGTNHQKSLLDERLIELFTLTPGSLSRLFALKNHGPQEGFEQHRKEIVDKPKSFS